MLRKFNLIFGLVILLSAIASAQIPDTYTNLKILPKDISKKQLLETMKGFSGALGVRCTFCHVGEEGQPLSTFDFASDEKTNKNKARIMLEMVSEINSKHLNQFTEYNENVMDVSCTTCHHGANQPKLLEEVLFEEIQNKSIDEAILTYHNLYDEYYGGFTYDFKDHTLVNLTNTLINSQMIDEAVSIGKLNLEMYPNSGMAYFGIASAYEANSDKENAIKNYESALELMPRGADFLKRKIESLKEN
jgi:tetratricopeptide (TPR) repeat protein